MIKSIRLLIVLGSVAINCNTVAAQAIKRPATASTKPTSRVQKQFNHSEKINTSYDRFENRTMVDLDLSLKELEGLDKTSLSVSYFYDGKTPPKKVGEVLLSITRFFGRPSDYHSFSNPTTLVLLLDNQRLRVPMKTERTIGLALYDKATAWISYPQLRQIANARNIEGRIGDIEFSLTESHTEALQDFTNRLSR